MRNFLQRLLILFFLFCNQIISAGYNFYFSHLGVEDGLSQVSVRRIFQDSDGYLWFGTRNGINKYDGYEFKVFRNEVNNPESLNDSYIYAINEDKEQNLWVGTKNGLNCIHYLSEKITRIYPQSIDSSITSNTVYFVIKHSDGNLYAFVNNKVLLCNPDKSVKLFKTLPDIDLQTQVQAVKQDEDKDIYISTSKGMFIYSENWEIKKKYSNDRKDFPKSIITEFLPDTDKIWIGTDDDGIFLFDKMRQTFTQYNKANTQLSNNSIRALIPFNKDSIFIGTFGGLNILDKKTNRISPLHMDSESYGGLDHYSIHSMLTDRDRTVWIGTYAGINYFSPYHKPISFLSSNDYHGIIAKGQEDKYGNMWFATEGGGLLYYNPKTKKQRLYPLKPLNAGNYEINIFKSILIEGDKIYCSTHFGSIYTFSIPQKKYELLHDFKINDIYTLLLDSRKRLWIPTFNQHHLVIVENDKIRNRFYINGEMRHFQSITAILEHEDNVFILGSYFGKIYLFDMNKQTVTNINEQIPLNKGEQIGTISSIAKEASHIWISTTKMGLFKFDNHLKLIKHYGNDDGLSDSHISAVVIDRSNCLWVATGNEIFRLNRTDDKFYSLSPTGSPIQEFTIHSGTVSSDGTVYFPGNKGIVSFMPQNLAKNLVIPPVYITSLTTNNENVIDKMKVNNNEKKYTKNYSITLNSNQNNLSVGYTALNYIHSEGNKYMFMMENIDNTWHNVGNRREAYYSNLHPGDYTFRLKASNNEGIWNPAETILHIHVRPPGYKTWWAYTLYIFLLLTTLLLIVKYQHKKHKREQELRYKQIEQDKLNELHEERMRMYTNFSHELKTPLTLIMNPLEDLTRRVAFSPEVKQSLQKMKKNTDRMLLLVKNLMDIQKYEAGKNILNKTRFNFSAFIEDIYMSFERLAENRNITFLIKNELDRNHTVFLDETEIEKVFFNLLSNAFKFTPSNGNVTITIQRLIQDDKNYLSVKIEDSGKGFSEAEAKVIFEPFYKFGEDLHRQMPGTGIGLCLVRSIIMQHHGFVKAESKNHAGSTFTILLPDTEVQTETNNNRSSRYQVSGKVQATHDLLEKVNHKNKKIVLLVENDREILHYLEEQLATEYILLKAGNGKEALSVIKEKIPHIVISDIVMPVMNGIELCDKIKKHPNLCHIPVILLTGKSNEIQKKQGFDNGADDYITKPFNIALFQVRIKNLVENREKIKSVYGNIHLLKNLGIHESYNENENEFLNKYIEFVKSNISNPDLEVSSIYQNLGMSRANFYRKVKDMTHLSPTDLIRNIRLDAGAKLLVESDKNISEIAQITGFVSRTYFTRSFKSEYGISPSEYKKANTK
jgi:signal transduction histidine kinase/ligand-binding sensor domain-containing protein/DNA-binding response OmpR family regulator